MQKLNLPVYQFQIQKEGDKAFIYDAHRKKYIALTPEEWVRQHFLKFLIKEKNYAPGLIATEKTIQFNNLTRRCDIVLYNKQGKPLGIVECKSYSERIGQHVFDQIARYTIPLKVKLLIVTNGMEHYACLLDSGQGTYHFLKDIPEADQLI
jgi:type I site-specific restriction endonuclease